MDDQHDRCHTLTCTIHKLSMSGVRVQTSHLSGRANAIACLQWSRVELLACVAYHHHSSAYVAYACTDCLSRLLRRR